MTKIPIFIINLPESIDRRAFMKTQCESLDVSPVFIDAVYGKDLSKLDIEKYCDQKKAMQIFGRELLLGEIGCALSHKKIYQKMIEENIDYAVVLEDDAIVSRDIEYVLKSILSSELNWDLILLGHYKNNIKGIKSPISLWDKHFISTKYTLGRLADFGFGTHGYLITLKGAKKLNEELFNIHRPIDHYTSDSQLFNVYALEPTVINVENNFETLIDNIKIREQILERSWVPLARKLHLIDVAVSIKSFLKTLKPIKKYK